MIGPFGAWYMRGAKPFRYSRLRQKSTQRKGIPWNQMEARGITAG